MVLHKPCLGLPKHDWPRAFAEFFAERNKDGLEAIKAASASRPQSAPSLPPANYAGTYEDPWAYDTFIVRWPDPLIEPAFVSFTLDAQGKPERIRMKAVSPVADFSFDYHDLEFTPAAAP